MSDRTCYYCHNIGCDLVIEIDDELTHVHSACVESIIAQARARERAALACVSELHQKVQRLQGGECDNDG